MKNFILTGLIICLGWQSVSAQDPLAAPDYEKLLNTLEAEAQQAYFENHHQTALRKWKQCTSIYEQLGDSLNIAKTKVRVGTIYAQVGEYATAFSEIKSAETLFSALNEQHELLQTYKTAARLHYNLANYAEMLSFYEQGLALAEKLKSTGEKVQMLVGIGQTYYLINDFTQARANYRRALKLVTINAPNWWQARIITYFGILAYYESQIDSARFYFEQAVEIQKSIEDAAGLKDNFVNLGIVHLHEDNLTAAGEAFSRAIALQKELHDLEGEIETEIRLGDVAYQQLLFSRAEQLYLSALAHSNEAGDRALIAESRKKIGFIYFSQNYPERAEHQLQEALSIARSINDPETSWRILHGLGLVSDRQNLTSQAFQYYYQALGFIELSEFHRNISAGKSEFTRTETDVYLAALETALKLAQRTGLPEWDERIFEISERKKLRRMHQELQSLDFHTCPATVIQQIRTYRAYTHQFTALNKLLVRERRKELLKQNIPKIISLQKHLKAIENRQFELQTEIIATAPEMQNLFGTLVPSLTQFQQALQPDQVALKYILLETRLVIQIIRPQGVDCVDVAYIPEELLTDVNEFSTILHSGSTGQSGETEKRYQRLRQKLSHLLLEPLQEKLTMATELIILPDVPLQFLPFDVLLWKAKGSSPVYLIEEFPVRNLTRVDGKFIKTNPIDAISPTLNLIGRDPSDTATRERLQKLNWTDFHEISIPEQSDPCPPVTIDPGICQIDWPGEWVNESVNQSFFRRPGDLWYLPDWFRMNFTPRVLLCLPELAIIASEPDSPFLLPEIVKFMGVRGLIGSRQRLEPRAQKKFLLQFYQNLIAGVSPAKSLQLAKINWIHSSEYAAPGYWTQFFLVY